MLYNITVVFNMHIKQSDTIENMHGPVIINEYKINPNFSGAMGEINGIRGKIRNVNERRIYFILKGKGKFIVNGEEHDVAKSDLVFIPKNTPYNIEGNMKYFLVCSPEFNPANDVAMR